MTMYLLRDQGRKYLLKVVMFYPAVTYLLDCSDIIFLGITFRFVP